MEEEIFCPDCNDTRIVPGIETREECCGYFTKSGQCCNNPIAIQNQVPVQCNRCNFDLI